MKNNSLFKNFISCVSMSVLGILGVSCYVLADTFFIALDCGADGLTALNLAVPVYNLMHGTGLMLGMGGATKFTVFKSQERTREASTVFSATFFAACVFSVIFSLAGALFSSPLSVLLGADESVLELTNTYLRWLMIFAPSFILNDVLLCFVRNDDAPRLSMIAMIVGSLSNILLDYIFIFPLKMGIFGAVFASGISPLIGISVMALHKIKKRNSFHFVRGFINPKIFAQVASLGFPSLLGQVSAAVVMIIFNLVILGISGNTGVAAYGVVANISIVVTALFTGVAQGVQPLISGLYGRNGSNKIFTLVNYSYMTVFVLSALIYACVFVFAQPITQIFNSEHNEALQSIAPLGLRLYFTATPFVGYNTVLATYFTSIENPLPAHILSLLRGLILIIPLTFLLAGLWGMTGVWLVYPLTELIVAILGVFVYGRSKRRRKKLTK